MAVKRYVVGADLHFPKISKPTVNVFFEIIKDIKPAGVILQGDQFDNAEISHHNANKPLYKERRSFLKNQEDFDNEFLTPLEELVSNTCELTWLVGNHDYWEYEFVEQHPELEGIVDRVQALGLVERGWEVIPLGHSKRLGELNIIHGEILTGVGNQAGAYPSRKAVEMYAGNVLAAHTHAPQSYTKISPVDHKKKHMGWIAPILGATNPAYLKNRPTAWLSGLTVVELRDKGLFNCYPVIVIDGSCSYGGKEYKG